MLYAFFDSNTFSTVGREGEGVRGGGERDPGAHEKAHPWTRRTGGDDVSRNPDSLKLYFKTFNKDASDDLVIKVLQ